MDGAAQLQAFLAANPAAQAALDAQMLVKDVEMQTHLHAKDVVIAALTQELDANRNRCPSSRGIRRQEMCRRRVPLCAAVPVELSPLHQW